MTKQSTLLPRFNWRQGYWYVTQGKETFFNENNEMITFKTEIDAIKWIDQHQREKEEINDLRD